MVEKPVDHEGRVPRLRHQVEIRILTTLQKDCHRVRITLDMEEFAERNACRLRSTDERDALVGNHEGSGVELAQKLLLNWMAMVGTDAIANACGSDRETDPLAPPHPLRSVLIAIHRHCI